MPNPAAARVKESRFGLRLGNSNLAGGAHGHPRRGGVAAIMVVRHLGRGGGADHPAVARAFEPAGTFATFPGLWFDRAATRNLLTTLRRRGAGFGLAALVGVPLGVLCGCFPRVKAFFMPVTVFGRYISVAAARSADFFALRHRRSAEGDVHFHCLRGVRVVGYDAGCREIGGQYIDTAYTLGSAGTWQTIGKVLLPLALPSVFNSLRLIVGLAFGYIRLAEVVKFGAEAGGVGDLINISQRRPAGTCCSSC